MDLGLVTTEGGVGVGGAEDTSTTTSVNAASSAANSSDPFGINISKTLGSSGLLKQQRSGVSSSLHDTWRAGKVPRPNEFGGGSIGVYTQTQAPTFLRSGSMIPSSNGQTMISFSSQSQTPVYPDEDVGVKTSAFPFFLSSSSQDQLTSKTSDKDTEAIRGPFARFRGPFTPSQWMELEHQALIFKHILANVPVPSHLLIPLKKSFNPYAFTGFSSGSYGSSSLGWGSFHLGFAGSTDPEPGRCRRTDGKKWRCSRDAVPDQKYCERHINRGRHRSRKPVEGQTGHAVSGSTASKGLPNASSSSASVISSSSVSNCLGGVQQHQFKNLQPGAANTANEHLVSRMQDLQSLSMLGDTINLKSKDSSFPSQKPQAQIGGSTQPEFGIVSPHSLLNPSQKSSTMNSSRETSSFTSSFNEQDVHPLRHFIDNWPKDHSDRGSVTWPEELKSDWTQLSMSIPMSSSDFSSSSNSPPQEKITTLSSLRLAREIDHIQMGLSVNNEQKHSNWLLPVSWGSTSNSNNSSLGGPLGEVLNSTTSYCMGVSRNSSAGLNLMTQQQQQQQQQQQMWGGDGSSPPPQMGCSPTGVLQKSTFVSLSNSSSGSSPRNDHNNNNNNKVKAPKGDILASSASIPSI